MVDVSTLTKSVPSATDSGTTPFPRVQPFLRWAGGKRWLVPIVTGLIRGHTFEQYHEPFLGGGSVFLGTKPSPRAFLADLNHELIEVYAQIQQYPDEVAKRLLNFENTAECYYETRATLPTGELDRAARFIFLNHSSFNGIFRVNLRGEYNVPYGNRASIRIPSVDHLRQVSEQLRSATLLCTDFEAALANVGPGDLVFLDPPYTVAHNNNGFVKYNQHLFSFQDQIRLAEEIKRIRDIGGHFILTNAAHSSIEELFAPLGRKLTVSRRNAVGGKLASRGKAKEFLFTSIGNK